MEDRIIREEIEKLNQRYRINKWVELISAILLLIFSFYLIEVSYQGSEIKIISFLAEGKAYLMLGPLSGSMLGMIFIKWGGSKELVLLNRIAKSRKNT